MLRYALGLTLRWLLHGSKKVLRIKTLALKELQPGGTTNQMCFYSIYYFHQRESKLFDIIESMQRMKKKMAWSILKTLRQFNFFMCVYTESVFFSFL